MCAISAPPGLETRSTEDAVVQKLQHPVEVRCKGFGAVVARRKHIMSNVLEMEVNELFLSSVLPWRSVTAPRVLIIEDDPDVHLGWSVFLGHQGYQVFSADEGNAGLQAIEEHEPDIVLLDLGLPGMHGFKVLHEIRMRSLPVQVVVVSADASLSLEDKASRLGALSVLQKPIAPQSLVSVIEDLMN